MKLERIPINIHQFHDQSLVEVLHGLGDDGPEGQAGRADHFGLPGHPTRHRLRAKPSQQLIAITFLMGRITNGIIDGFGKAVCFESDR